jgi:hypothetical protein
MPKPMVNRPIHHTAVRHDYFMVECIDGTRRMLGIPIGTPTRLVDAKLEDPE